MMPAAESFRRFLLVDFGQQSRVEQWVLVHSVPCKTDRVAMHKGSALHRLR
jgi:hypothetical protein